MRNILITGGAGFIPSSLADVLLQDPQNFVVAVDNFITGKPSNICVSDRYKFIHSDANSLQDMATIMTSYRFDYVFHYAALVGVKRTLENPLMVLADIEGIKNILHLSKNTGVKRVFFSSSSEVYGEPVEIPQNEHTTPLNSKLPYAIVKNVGEAFLKSYQREHGLNYTIFRFFNTYGPKQSTDFVLSKFLRSAMAGKDLTVYGDGLQSRTFCYIDDNLQSTLRCLNEGLHENDVINLGATNQISILDLAKLVIELTGSNSKILHLPPLKDGDMKRRCPDNSKMVKLLGRDLVQLQAGILRVIESIQSTRSTASNHWLDLDQAY